MDQNPTDPDQPSASVMEDDEITHPHDKLFKVAFGDPANTAGLLQAKLSPALRAAIDWSSLRPEKGSFVDSKYRSSQTDLLFSAKIRDQDVMLYVLFEHQSTPDWSLFFRLLRYMCRIWEELERRFLRGQQPRKLPPILPVVLFQNAKVWEMPTKLSDLLDIPAGLEAELLPFIPDFTFKQMQLAGMEYEAIPGTSAGIFVLRAMKAERLNALLSDPVWEDELIAGVPLETFHMVLRYILGTDVDKADFEARIKRIENPEIRNQAMTLAQVYRQEGRQEGRQEALIGMIVDLLGDRIGPVPEGLAEAIAKVGDPEKLRSLVRRAASVSSFEEFAKGL